ncbi:MAG TPA: ATP-dependent zinc metalloprotease FtsH [Planctomycetota bacterium]|nr:ATP-dependent zinc metalloprotease FtsH [Planctomycetota bacterium]
MNRDDGSERDEPKAPRRPRSALLLLVLVFLAVMALIVGSNPFRDQVAEVGIRQYEQELKQGNVAEIWIEQNTIVARLATAKPFPDHGNRQFSKIRATIPDAYLQEQVGFDRLTGGIADPSKIHNSGPSFWQAFLIGAVPWIILIVLAWWLFVRQIRATGGPGNVLAFGRSRAKFVAQEKVRVTFDDVAGIDEAKEDVKEIIEFLKDPAKFTRLGGRIPRGVLLVGPPGTGKTLLAKAIAGEAGVPFLSITGSDFVEMFVGVGAARVRDLFNTAKEKSPCIVFIDEIDAVGRRRGTGLGGGHDEREQTLNQILVEMDGFDTDEGVIVIAATNRPDVLDPALLRPGRFDREVVIDLPDVKGREEILKVHTKRIKLARDVDLKLIGRATPMFSGADLANLVNEAAIIATMKRKDAVEMADLEEARDKVLWGRQKKSRVILEEEKKLTAFHEAGHTVVSVLLTPDTDPVHKVTVIPRGRMGGGTMFLPDKERYGLSLKRCRARLAVAFGGRVGEETFIGDVSSGAHDDIKQATELARTMVCEWGMSERLGPIRYTENEEHMFLGREIAKTRTISDETMNLIDTEVHGFLTEALRTARDLITHNKEKVEKIAAALMKYETLSGDEVTMIINGEDFEGAKQRQLREDQARQAERDSEEKRRETSPGWKPTGGAHPLPGTTGA